MELIQVSQDTQTLALDLFQPFKEHLRILHDTEDSSILLYLSSAMDAIATYGDFDIFLAEYEVLYNECIPIVTVGWYCGRQYLSDVLVVDSQGVDVTADFRIDEKRGKLYPNPCGSKVTFKAGFIDADSLPPRLVNIIFRYGASMFENRETIRVGEPKLLPDWVKFVIPSIWNVHC